MKRNQIILLSIFILVTGLIFVRIRSNKKTPIKEIKSGKTILYILVAHVQNSSRDVFFAKLKEYSRICEAYLNERINTLKQLPLRYCSLEINSLPIAPIIWCKNYP